MSVIACHSVMGKRRAARRSRSRSAGLSVPALATGLVYAFLAHWSRVLATAPEESLFGRWRRPNGIEDSFDFLLLWTIAFGAYAVAVNRLPPRGRKGSVWFLLVTSVAFRALVLAGDGFHLDRDPHASWLVSGFPLQIVDSGTALVPGASPALVATLFDLGSLALLPGLLRRAGLSPQLILVYGWNPLAIKEVAASGREEAIALFFLLLALRLVGRPRSLVIGAYAACLMGPFAWLTTIPGFWRVLGRRVLLSLVPAAAAWAWWIGSGGWTAIDWLGAGEVGGSLVPAVAAATGLFVSRDPLIPLLVCQLGFWLVILRRATRPIPKGRAVEAWVSEHCLVAYGGFLLVAPAVPPWSFAPLAALAAFSSNRGWLVLTATAPVSYFALASGNGTGWSFWLGFAQFFPAYAALVFHALGVRASHSDGDTGASGSRR